MRNAEGTNDLVGLSRDTANANEKIDRPDKKAMEERMELIRSSVELVNGISDAIATAKMKAAQDSSSDEYRAARQQLLEHGNSNPTDEQIAQQVSQYFGMGSSFKKATQAISAVVQGVLGGNIGGALVGAASPYVAQSIKEATDGDNTASLMAHAVWGAVVATSQGNSALAGATGAGVGEYIAKQLYPNKSVNQLTESEKQTVSALSTLAGGLIGGLAAGGLDSAVAAAGTAKNAAENNDMGMMAGSDLGFWLSKANDCDTACKAKIAEQNARGGLVISSFLLAGVIGSVGVAAAPEVIAAARAAGQACAANPALCINEITLWAAEAGMGEALPAGLALGGASKLTAEQLSDMRALMELEKKTKVDVSSDIINIVVAGGGGAKSSGRMEVVGNGEGIFKKSDLKPYTPDTPVLSQANDASCAAASCRMAANLGDVPEAYIREAIGTTHEGTALSKIPSGLKELGFEGRAEYTSSLNIEALTGAVQNGGAVVASVRAGEGAHAIVVESVQGGRAFIKDPWPVGAGSSYSVPIESLKSVLTGGGVVIYP